MDDQSPGNSRNRQLRKAFESRDFRHSYMARQLKAFLAQQIRALRGGMRQSEFGEKIGKPQSVVSRLEKQMNKQISVQTLIDIARALDIAVLIRFVDFDTFLNQTAELSDDALVPLPYSIDKTAEPQMFPPSVTLGVFDQAYMYSIASAVSLLVYNASSQNRYIANGSVVTGVKLPVTEAETLKNATTTLLVHLPEVYQYDKNSDQLQRAKEWSKLIPSNDLHQMRVEGTA